MTRFAPILLLPLLLVAAREAAADPRVPPIPDAQLPVAGTCAPMRNQDVTIVTIGPRTDLRWFGVSGVAQPVLLRQLGPLLKQRAGSARPSQHAVWITASAGHLWAHVASVRNACAAAGIYRVGLRVRSESTGQVMGFPLFLSAAPGAQPSPTKAGRLKVKVVMVPEKQSKAPSDIGHVYAAARRALDMRGKWGIDKVVAEVRLPMLAPLQYAVTTIDVLYRAGVSGVRLRGGVRIPRIQFKVVPKLEIQGGVVSRIPQQLKPPPIRPRSVPWAIDGANEPGWVDLTIQDLPAIGSTEGPASTPTASDLLPNYAEGRQGVPASVRQQMDNEIRTWARGLGADILAGLRGGPELEARMSPGLRGIEGQRALIDPARKAFPDAAATVTSTLQFNVLLFGGGRLVGRVDATVSLAGRQVGLIFANWKDAVAGSMTLPPFEVDPYAGGEPARFRVWFEAIFDVARKVGARGLPLAPADEVLRYFPRVAHAGVRRSIEARMPSIETLATRLAQAPYDRLVLSAQRGTATVVAGRRVVGVLNFSLTAQERALRIDDLAPRRAPR